MGNTALALTGFVAWTLALLILMEVIRTHLVFSRQVPSNGFQPDNANLSPFMQRLARAYLNCLEGLPIFGGLMAIALMTDRTAVTDTLALWLLLARIVQSCIHLASLSVWAVNFRFTAFAVQIVFAVIWTLRLLAG